MNYIRTFASGNKKRYIDEKYNLDLSYITNRIIAMAYPASGLEKVYKNSIKSVSKFLNDKHKSKYYVFNLSGKKYDNTKFENRVYEFDYQENNMKTIFFICQGIHKFLNECIDNVAVVHCDVGKGRTVTVICCYLLYCGRLDSAEAAFEYYNKKRLATGDACIQPSQKRYIHYFEQIMKEKIYFPYLISILDISLSKYPLKKADAIRPYIEILVDDKVACSSKTNYSEQKKFYAKNNPPFLGISDGDFKFYCTGDFTIKCFNNKMLTTKRLGKVSLNSAFFQDDQREITVKLSEIDPITLMKSKKIPKDLEVKITFVRLCQCNNRVFPVSTCEICTKFVEKHFNYWQEIHRILENHKPSLEDGRMFLFGDPTEDDIDMTLKLPESNDEVVSEEIKKTEGKEELNNSFDGECIIF